MKNQGSTMETGMLVLGIIITLGMAIIIGIRTATAREARLRRS